MQLSCRSSSDSFVFWPNSGKATVFLFTDTQIVTESFVEDINNILNSGEVPALFDQQDKDRMCADIRPYAESMGLSMSKDVLYNTFINRVRDNLHIIDWSNFPAQFDTTVMSCRRDRGASDIPTETLSFHTRHRVRS